MSITGLPRLTRQIIKLRLGMVYPITANFFLTDKCDLSCITCDMWNRNPHTKIIAKDLGEFLKNSHILKGLAFVNLEGGELFILDEPHEYFFVIQKNIKPTAIRFTTNGYNTERIIESIKIILKHTKIKLGVRLSLDGFQKTHDYLRGKEGAFEHAVRTLQSLTQLRDRYKNLAINIGLTVNAQNLKEIEKVYNFANELRVGFTVKPIQDTKVLLERQSLKRDLLLTADMNEYLAATLERIKLNHMPYSEKLIHRLLHSQFLKCLKCNRRMLRCYAGRGVFSLVPNGDVVVCFVKNYVIGNLYKNGFDEIWFSKEANKVRQNVTKDSCYCICNTETMTSLIVEKFPFYF